MRCGCRRYWRQTVGRGDCCCRGNGPRHCGECADVCERERGWRMASPGQRERGEERKRKRQEKRDREIKGERKRKERRQKIKRYGVGGKQLTAEAEEANEEEEVRGEGTKVSGEFNTNSFAVGSSLKFFIALENKRDIHERLCTVEKDIYI